MLPISHANAVQWMYHGVTPVELAALYNIADALIVSSLRDGMNLTALEYVGVPVLFSVFLQRTVPTTTKSVICFVSS